MKRVFDSVVVELLINPERTFTQAEVMYFRMWWLNQSDATRQTVRKLVKEGRFEFVHGGWVATDEACPSFEDMIANMQVGH